MAPTTSTSRSNIRSNAGKMFPHLADSDFDRGAHNLRGKIDGRDWEPQNWPFHISTLPRLPPIHNRTYFEQATTHRSWFIQCGERSDPEPLCLNSFETLGDGVLNFWCLETMDQHGINKRSGDMVYMRSKFISNTTFSYVAWSYRLHHLLRHQTVMSDPPQKILADMFEAYIGAAWRDHRDRGQEHKMIEWLREFFHPRHWIKWEETKKGFDNGQARRDEKVQLAMAKTARRVERDRKRELSKESGHSTGSGEDAEDQVDDRQVKRMRQG